MAAQRFEHHDLFLPDIPFSSPLTELIFELEHFHKRKMTGTTHPLIFSQLKEIFHILESIGSARIEGNNTTIAEFIETRLENGADPNPDIKEILNLEHTMDFIENNIGNVVFDKAFIIRLNELITDGLPSEIGVELIGEYRTNNVRIAGVSHIPPDYQQVNDYMKELLDFIKQPLGPQFDLLRIAVAHHRFVWIHPFNDGNGRTVRMLTHAMLLRSGFGGTGRIINPVAIFCIDRKEYYRYLSEADKGNPEGIVSWCKYVLSGFRIEMEKIDRLLDYEYLKKEILLPALAFSRERQFITNLEAVILRKAIEKQVIQAADIREYFPGKDNAIISRQIKGLIGKRMLIPLYDGARKYVVGFSNNFLLRGIIKSLGDRDFLPVKD
jgi:Fic family protein